MKISFEIQTMIRSLFEQILMEKNFFLVRKYAVFLDSFPAHIVCIKDSSVYLTDILTLTDVHEEYGVGPGGVFVHVGLSDTPILLPALYEVHDLTRLRHTLVCQILTPQKNKLNFN